LLWVPLLFGCSEAATGKAEATSHQQLRLASQRVISVPPDHESGGVFVSNGEILSWGTSPIRVLWWSGSRPVRALRSPMLRGPVGAAVGNDGHAVVADSSARSELTFDSTGQVVSSMPLKMPLGKLRSGRNCGACG
jgi:hypothetical protein